MVESLHPSFCSLRPGPSVITPAWSSGLAASSFANEIPPSLEALARTTESLYELLPWLNFTTAAVFEVDRKLASLVRLEKLEGGFPTRENCAWSI